MAEWSKRRNWIRARVSSRDSLWGIALDGNPLMSPARNLVELPALAAAELVAREWDEPGGAVHPESMPFTRLAFSAIDKVEPSREQVAAEIAGYGETDLICYRAESPPELIAKQESAWQPLLAWCEDEFGATLHATRGVAFIAQPESSLSKLNQAVANLNAFELASFFEFVSATGSLVLGLAVERGFLLPSEAWRASRLDEDWQLEKWGNDSEALKAAESRKKDMMVAFKFLEAIRKRNK